MGETEQASKESKVVFVCGEESFAIADVIDAAHFRGELAHFWTELLARLAAERKGNESDADLDSDELDASAVAFRYRYDLITAEETEAWLDARGLTLADFSDYFAREQWGKILAGKVQPTAEKYEEASEELRELLRVELVMSGETERMATRLAWRVAAQAATEGADEDALAEERKNFLKRHVLNEAEIAHWLSGLEREEAWLDQMIQREAVFRARCAARMTEEAFARELSSLRLPLTRFQVEMLEVESRDAASEAFMCVRDDGMSMAEVAQEGRYPLHQTEMVLEQIADDLQQKFLSLTPGSLLEPAAREDGFVLTRILAKREPTLEDPEVRERVERRILERHFGDLAAGRVRWQLGSNNVSE